MGYTAFTLPKSGEVVLIQPVSPLLLAKLRRKYTKENPVPQPPVQRVNMGTHESPIWEESVNESHPDYLEAKREYAQAVEMQVRRSMLALGAEIEWTDAKHEALTRLREKAARAGLEDEIEEDDNHAYISYIAVKAPEDYNALLTAIMEGSQPTEGAIEEGIATFRPEPNGQEPHLQGEEHI